MKKTKVKNRYKVCFCCLGSGDINGKICSCCYGSGWSDYLPDDEKLEVTIYYEDKKKKKKKKP